MKSFKKLYLFYLLLSVLFVACKKDNSSTTAQSLIGTYNFSNISEFEIKRWGQGGAELLVEDSIRAIFLSKANNYKEDAIFTFISNSQLQINDTVNNNIDTISYKIEGNVVLIDVRDIPFFDVDFYPVFKIAGENIYTMYQYVELKNNFGSGSTSIQTAENYSLLDSVLKEEGYSSLSDLSANDEITMVKYRINYKR